MGKLTMMELTITAGAAIISVAKYVLKFVDCIFKLRPENATATA